MTTTYQINTSELDSKFIDSIKSYFPDKEILIDIYPISDFHLSSEEITNPEIISRIHDLRNNVNIIFPQISLK